MRLFLCALCGQAKGFGPCRACFRALVQECSSWRTQEALGLGAYGGRLKAAVLRLKRGAEGSDAACAMLALLLSRLILREGLALDALIPMPRPRARLFLFQNNGPFRLARAISRRLDVPLFDVLSRSYAPSQTKLSASSRARNVKGTLTLNLPCVWTRESALRIGLVDDVMTTGSTLNEARETLLLSFPKAQVSFVVLARPRVGEA